MGQVAVRREVCHSGFVVLVRYLRQRKQANEREGRRKEKIDAQAMEHLVGVRLCDMHCQSGRIGP